MTDSTASQSEAGDVAQKAAACAATLLSSDASSTEQLVLQHLPWLIRISGQQALIVLKVRVPAGHQHVALPVELWLYQVGLQARCEAVLC